MNRHGMTFAALGGVLYPVLAISGLVLAGPTLPADFSAPPAEILPFLEQNPASVLTRVGLAMEVAGLLALLAFGARLAWESLEPWTAQLALAVLAVGVAIKTGSMVPAIVGLMARDGLAPETVALLFRLNDAAVPVADAMTASFVLLAGAGVVARGPVPSWLGWAGLVAGTALLIDPVLGSGWLSLPVLLWLMVTAVALARAGERPVAAPDVVTDASGTPPAARPAGSPAPR